MTESPQSLTVGAATITAEQVSAVLEAYPQLSCARLVVEAGDVVTLLCEVRKADVTLAPSLRRAVAEWEVGGRVVFVNDGTLAPDAPLIDDRR